MEFTREQLIQLSEWQSLHFGFNRVGYEYESLLQETIEPLLDDLRQKSFECTVFEDGGLTNYYAVWVRELLPPEQTRGIAYISVDGVSIYLSLLEPYVALGRVRDDLHSRGFHLHFGPSSAFDPASACSKLELAIIESLGKTPYKILTTAELGQIAPDDIQPFEYCLYPEEGNTVFHLMFANTD